MADTRRRSYKIEKGMGTGGLLCPPGHHRHTYTLVEYRGGHDVGHYGLDYVNDPAAHPMPDVKAEARRIMRTESVPSELWIRHTYGYMRNMYVPDGGSRNASDLINFRPADDVTEATVAVLRAAGFQRGGRAMLGDVDGFRTAVRDDGSLIHVRQVCGGVNVPDGPMLPLYAAALTAAGYGAVEVGSEHVRAVPPVIPVRPSPERHAAVGVIREYFPDHEPRVDLILNPGKGYGAYPCDRCGERVQYEARYDALCVVSTRLGGSGITEWSYGRTCTDGAPHTVTD